MFFYNMVDLQFIVRMYVGNYFLTQCYRKRNHGNSDCPLGFQSDSNFFSLSLLNIFKYESAVGSDPPL